jgi:hypothetical protein
MTGLEDTCWRRGRPGPDWKDAEHHGKVCGLVSGRNWSVLC